MQYAGQCTTGRTLFQDVRNSANYVTKRATTLSYGRTRMKLLDCTQIIKYTYTNGYWPK